jgi:small Trp-rich protein
MEEKNISSGGVGCLTVVGIVFVVLKLVGVQPVAGWSWWWVTAPFWGPFAFLLALLLFSGACMSLFGSRRRDDR